MPKKLVIDEEMLINTLSDEILDAYGYQEWVAYYCKRRKHVKEVIESMKKDGEIVEYDNYIKKGEVDKMNRIKLGAVANRHEMPVDEYVLKEVEDPMDFKAIKIETFKKILSLAIRGITHIDYYPTGLGQVTLAFEDVIKVVKKQGYEIKCRYFIYDRDTNSYKEFEKDSEV